MLREKRPQPEVRNIDDLPVSTLNSVGPSTAERLEKLGIRTVQDLLFHLPYKYQDRTRITPIGSLRPGDQVVIEGTIEDTEVSFRGKRMLVSHVADGTGRITIRFFHFSNAQKNNLREGLQIRCFGEVRGNQFGLEIIHPEYTRIDPHQITPVEETLTPIYPATERLQQTTLRNLTAQALQLLRSPQNKFGLAEYLPQELRTKYQFPTLDAAIEFVHRPPPDACVQDLEERRYPAQQRLAFEELLAHQLSLRNLRKHNRSQAGVALRSKGLMRANLLQRLPFALTPAQTKVSEEILHDLSLATPMMRLVQGDVGSGKTIVAALVALQAIESGYQVAIMAPTELLADQHLRNFEHWLRPLDLQVAWLSGKRKGKKRAAVLQQIKSGEAAVVVGTHALFQSDVTFEKLALIIIDEQHRFGVHQRLALREKGQSAAFAPHQLIMTATPIPRTLAMTAYADLDLSIIDELPPGRTPVTTVVIPDHRREEIFARVRDACLKNRQAYWVCTLIEESEKLQCQAAEDTAALLTLTFPELSVGLIHGRMKAPDKELIMSRFQNGELQLLVATTVIEVGVDVPNASLMIIENAERLGLAQLHQLRGRVGRGAVQSSCVLMYHGPLSGAGKQRLSVMRQTNDGFEIAKRDLEIRGPGEVLGTRQTGVLQLHIADLVRDQHMLPRIFSSADQLLQSHPKHAQLLIRRWLGTNALYAQV